MIRNLTQLLKVLHVNNPAEVGPVLCEVIGLDGRCHLQERGVLLVSGERQVPVSYPFRLQFLEIVALSMAA